jgi:multiple sugar transport system permease protein
MLETGTEFVLFENYLEVLTNSTYQNALWVTAKFVFFATGLEMLLGTAIAFLLNRNIRFRGGIQTLILIPLVISPTVVALLWQLLYTSGGLLDYIVRPLTGAPVLWLSEPGIALWSLIIADVWQMTPLVVLVVLAGLQAVPDHIQEAAVMDGAGTIRQFLDITFPFIKDLLFLVLILRVVGTMRVFAKVFVLTQGGPAGSTNVISMALYLQAFRFGNFGLASAMAVILLVIALLIAVTFAKIADVEF